LRAFLAYGRANKALHSNFKISRARLGEKIHIKLYCENE
jgi:hypothetical protein